MSLVTDKKWVGVSPQLPDSVAEAADTIQDVANLLLTLLNILLNILSIAKMFSLAFINPMQALVEAVINEIEKLIDDLRNAGVYVTGDIRSIKPPFPNLIGGFSAYERRMLTRLVDKTDPTRPDFSGSTTVFGLFLYTSTDVPNRVVEIVKSVQQLIRFFGQDMEAAGFTTPTNIQVRYGLEGQPLATFGAVGDVVTGRDPMNRASIQWQMAPVPGNTTVPFPLPGPAGFLLEVSTIPDGIKLVYEAPTKNAGNRGDGQATTTGVVVDARGQPFVLYGGSDQLNLGNNPRGAGDRRTGGTWVYGIRNASDSTPIPVGHLKDGDKYLLQRTFYVPTGFFSSAQAMTPGKGFNTTLRYEEMPHQATFDSGGNAQEVSDDPAKTVYGRLVPVSDKIVDDTTWKYAFRDEVGVAVSAGRPVILEADPVTAAGEDGTEVLTTGDRGPASTVFPITFPGATTATFLDALTAALAVMVLSRSDVSASDSDGQFLLDRADQPTGLEDISRFLFPLITGSENSEGYFKDPQQDPVAFRRDLLKRCRSVANLAYGKMGPIPSLEEQVGNIAEPLLNFKWADADGDLPDQTILESLESDFEDEEARIWLLTRGIGANPESVGLDEVNTFLYLDRNGSPEPTPGFFSTGRGESTVDAAPVIYNRLGLDGEAQFVRNVLHGYDGGSLYGVAAAVLNAGVAPLTNRSEDGQWLAFRLVPEGFPAIDEALDNILQWVEAIAASITTAADVLNNYIEALETRILEIQSIINRINGLLQSILRIQIPVQFQALALLSEGTDGLVSDLVTAEDKPNDPPTSYGTGIVLVAGGLPTALLDFTLGLFDTG